MRIELRKVSDQVHVLSIVRESGVREAVECETRSYLMHDLIHYAVESELGTAWGVWGLVASGASLGDIGDRKTPLTPSPELGKIETLVGLLSGIPKGRTAAELVGALRDNADALTWAIPEWFDEAFVERVGERLRRLLGHWKATSYGESMILPWPA